uniref:Flocculation protein FLO11-like n=1 Tax=Caenorhabditis tropicalis TaxID=1561998 RepID=A0A1I7TK67_9PELO
MDGKSGRNEKSKMSSGYEKDVLPSKSMKMKVAISPNMSISKKVRAPSKESITEESLMSKTEASQSEKTMRRPVPLSTTPAVQPPLPPLESTASTDVTTAVEPSVPVIPQSSVPFNPPLPPLLTSSNVPPATGSVQNNRAETSQSNESSMTSFTAPEDPTSVRSKGGISIPKNASTPTATTLSGVSSSASAPPEAVKLTDTATAKDITQVKSPITPTRTPEVTSSTPAAIIPINTSTPPPTSEKRFEVTTMFPSGCGSCV